jgi:hypothetical protein
MAFYRNLVGHGAAGAENGCFVAKNAGSQAFQVVDGRIFGENIVPDGGFHHKIKHTLTRTGDGIGPEVNKHAANLRFWPVLTTPLPYNCSSTEDIFTAGLNLFSTAIMKNGNWMVNLQTARMGFIDFITILVATVTSHPVSFT